MTFTNLPEMQLSSTFAVGIECSVQLLSLGANSFEPVSHGKSCCNILEEKQHNANIDTTIIVNIE